MAKRYFLLLVFILGGVWPAFTLDYWSLDGGLLVMINTDADSAPNPLLPCFGFSLPFVSSDNLYVEGQALFYYTNYFYRSGRAFPAEIEAADSYLVIGMLLDTRIGYLFKINDKLKLGIGGGLALGFRLPVYAYENSSDLGSAFTYLLSRFLYPELDLTLRWDITEKIGLSFSLRTYFPVFNLWDTMPFADSMLFSGLVGLRFKL